MPVNLATFFFLDTPTGFVGCIAAIIAFGANAYLIIANGGVSKVMAIPHLIAWIPLVVFLLWQLLLTNNITSGSGEHWLAWLLVIFNGISLLFDIYDTRQWQAGNRQLTGFPDVEPRY